eukprot:111148-Prymnesium_polylepis.1
MPWGLKIDFDLRALRPPTLYLRLHTQIGRPTHAETADARPPNRLKLVSSVQDEVDALAHPGIAGLPPPFVAFSVLGRKVDLKPP